MQIVEMITRRDGSLHLAVKIGNTEYINPLADWVRLAEQIIEEAETHLTPAPPDSPVSEQEYTGIVETHRCKCIVVDKDGEPVS